MSHNSVFEGHIDRRVQDIAFDLKASFPSAPHRLLSDQDRTLLDINNQNAVNSGWTMGRVVQALPYMNWYKVQLGRGGTVGCCAGSLLGSMTPAGPKPLSGITVNSRVMVWQPYGLNYGMIVSTLPDHIADGNIYVPDYISQDGVTGLKRESGFMDVLRNMYREGGVKNFNAGRPLDQTSLDWGVVFETGLLLDISPFEFVARVNEETGILLSYIDAYGRIGARNLDLHSSAWFHSVRNDEGEHRGVKGHTIYPWEALGSYQAAQNAFATFDPTQVQYQIPKGAMDLPDDQEDRQAIQRRQEFDGYLGQGGRRLVSAPIQTSGFRRYRDKAPAPDTGLFEESIGLDGTQMSRSAKQIFTCKYGTIPVPKEVRLPEDQKTGDDARKANYAFSGLGSNGQPHKISDVNIDVTDQESTLRRIQVLEDLVAHAFNWQGLHPFFYHQNDYYAPEESDGQKISAAQDKLNFDELANGDRLSIPQPKQVPIDHRYNQVNLFQRMSIGAHLEDGSYVLADGWGNRFIMGPQGIIMESAGDNVRIAGKSIRDLAGYDHVVRANNSFDISATNGDGRIKIQRNGQIIVGNDSPSPGNASGGLLIECRTKSTAHVYKDKVGQDVQDSGITFKCPNGEVTTLAQDIYLRTGGKNLGTGNITLDANRGRSSIFAYAQNFDCFLDSGLGIWFGAVDATSNTTRSHFLGRSTIILGAQTSILGFVTVGASLVVQSSIAAGGSIVCAGGMADGSGGPVGKVINLGSQVSQITTTASQAADDFTATGQELHDAAYVQRYYTNANAVGNEGNIKIMQFSFRDPQDQSQYRTKNLVMLETRFQQMARLGQASGLYPWKEQPVTNQGNRTFPWPGKKAWTDDTVARTVDSLQLFDAVNGVAKTRKDNQSAYEQGKVGSLQQAKMSDVFKVTVQLG